MISACCWRALSEPLPLAPVVWTARCNGVEPALFGCLGFAPLSSSALTADNDRFRIARCSGRTPDLSTALNQRIVALAVLATMARAIELFELRCRSRPDDAVEQGTAANRAERQITDRERFAVPHPQHDILDQGVPHELRTLRQLRRTGCERGDVAGCWLHGQGPPPCR